VPEHMARRHEILSLIPGTGKKIQKVVLSGSLLYSLFLVLLLTLTSSNTEVRINDSKRIRKIRVMIYKEQTVHCL
jgi:hypothetical protein